MTVQYNLMAQNMRNVYYGAIKLRHFMNKTVTVDVAIFGGGIAGLWLLNRLRAEGYSALLLESGALGGGQTCKSQGIIHGGMKYALTGSLNADALAVSDMPEIWRACLEGKGEIDLSDVPCYRNSNISGRRKNLLPAHRIFSRRCLI